MSDRLEEIRGYLGCADLHRATPSIAMALRQDALWLIDEIDRLRANEDSLCEKIRALTDENKRLRAEKEWK